MKKFLTGTSIAILALMAPQFASAADLDPIQEAAPAEEKTGLIPGEFSGSVGFFTDYRFRGISQTDNDFSVQGTIDYSIETPFKGISFYAGIFGANINFTPNTGAPDDGSLELDYYAGFSGSISKVNWSVGGLYFNYPDADNSLNQDFFEATLAFDTDVAEGLNVGLNYNVSPEFFGETGVAHFVQATAAYEIPLFDNLPLTVDGAIGYQEFEGTGDYLTWQVGLTAEVHKHLDIGVQYIDTNTSVVFEAAEVAGATVVGFISAKF